MSTATSGLWEDTSAAETSDVWDCSWRKQTARGRSGKATLWMALDAITVLGSAIIATTCDRSIESLFRARDVQQPLASAAANPLHLLFLAGFVLALILISRRLQLYAPTRLGGFLHEQRLSAQACLTAGLLLAGALYALPAPDVPRTTVAILIALVLVSLGFRRLIGRILLYRRLERGMDTRNVLIVGTGPEALALRHHLESIRHLGYSFRGFIEAPSPQLLSGVSSHELLGNFDALFQQVRQHFVDEVLITARCEPGLLHETLQQARAHGVDLRIVPDLYDGLVWDRPVEYLGQFPTIPLHRSPLHEIGMACKRALDIAFSATVLIAIAPLMAAIAIAIKLDTSGPVFYFSERIGKKGRTFRCTKFRTMVTDAEKRRSEVLHMNQRQGILFKAVNDPRVTRMGRILRKYSLDELPQFLNVLTGDMSVVGPRPPIASEVREYRLNDLRRLDVTPGITGLWQVQGRQDPSFDSYVSLDMRYIENWSLWLDFKIILRTVGVVLAGTGC